MASTVRPSALYASHRFTIARTYSALSLGEKVCCLVAASAAAA